MKRILVMISMLALVAMFAIACSKKDKPAEETPAPAKVDDKADEPSGGVPSEPAAAPAAADEGKADEADDEGDEADEADEADDSDDEAADDEDDEGGE